MLFLNNVTHFQVLSVIELLIEYGQNVNKHNIS